MFGEVAMYILSFFVISIGVISLFMQKVYKLEKEGGEQTVVELPFFGKLTTNYPAVTFAFVGAAMAVFTFSRTSEPGDETWKVEGKFTAPPSAQISDFRDGGVLTLYPNVFTCELLQDGNFSIHGPIKKGITFEDIVSQISYSKDKHYMATIVTGDEYSNYGKGQPSLLKSAEGTNRSYKPMEVNVVSQ